MLPIPGMDGWTVLSDFFPKLLKGENEVVKGTYFVLIVLFFVMFNKLFDICNSISRIEIELLARLFN